MSELDVFAVNRSSRIVILGNDEIVPITNFLDADRQRTEDPQSALVAIAGPTKTGKWLTIDLAGFQNVRTN